MSTPGVDLEAKLSKALNKKYPAIPQDSKERIPAAVLVPFLFSEGEWQLLFTRRTNGVATHQGEISFPGGAAEPEDKDLVRTALRESCEEIGICRDQIKVLGVMQPVPTISNYCVLPVIAILEWPQPLHLNYMEVDHILLIPVNWLRQEGNWYQMELQYATGKTRQTLHYKDYKGEHLWGLTADITQKVLDLL